MSESQVVVMPCREGRKREPWQRLSLERVEEIEAVLASGASDRLVARRCGVGPNVVGQIRRGWHKQQIKRSCPPPCVAKVEPKFFEPTPEEIEAACYVIRMARPEPEPWRFPGWEYAMPGSC